METNIDQNIPNPADQHLKGVYKILNVANEKFYIGSTTGKSFRRRWQYHMSKLLNNKHVNIHLQGAFNKYGKNSFQFIILEVLSDKNTILDKEQLWIDSSGCLNPKIGYNKYPKALCLRSEFIVSSETKSKLSKVFKGKPRPEWMKLKYGKPTLQLSKDGILIKEWPSIMEAARQLNIHPSNIKNCIKGRRGMKSYKGYIWKYKNN